MALTTDDPALTTAAESPTAPAPETPRPHRRGLAALVWVGAGLGLAAVAGLSIAALRDDGRPAKVDDNARTVIEHGSIAAIDHRADLAQAQRSPAETVAEHGSVAAADQRADDAQAQRTPAETVAEHGSVAAADQRAAADAPTSRTMAEHAFEQDPAFREQMVLAEQAPAPTPSRFGGPNTAE